MRSSLIAGNWKMNGSLQSVVELIDGIKDGDAGQAELAVCPPSVFLMKVGGMLDDTDIALGAQNVCNHDVGAYTGEISAAMLTECGCRYAIVGHSERRSLYLESDELVAARFAMAVSAGLTPILCVGETLYEHEQGVTEAVVAKQIDAVLENCGIAGFAQAVIAYEPVWAIGTGLVASPELAQSVHHFIRGKLAASDGEIAQQIRILYGGSMNSSNAADLLSQADIDGGLIGGASLKADDFLAIAQSV
ncbi:MAG: triose-phosphate isomerase [Gammaproteobacteria bacterium]|nr:MAG: triose-phosphate isomerase [Gammaproteobacteria bacterium]UCH40985.1 MAG: triose-phosphate isomerase [Gammaproteobacteria bacterium]